ncbi:MAG: GspH/FimT family pseudopilin [Candidatus Methylomirabilia bacterium]
MLSQKGFTLLELVVVLLVLAILSVFVAQKIGNVTSMKAAAFAKKLRADIRYAQNVAMTRNRRTRVYFNGFQAAPNPWGYAVVIDGAAGLCNAFAPVNNPDRSGNLTVTLDAGDYAGISVNPSTTCLEFDSLGTPYDCIANLANCASPTAGMTIIVPAAAAAVNTVTVTAGTGAVN